MTRQEAMIEEVRWVRRLYGRFVVAMVVYRTPTRSGSDEEVITYARNAP